MINGGAYEEIIDTSTGAVTQKSYVDGFMVQTKIGSTTEITYLHKDHLGSTEAMTDVKGNLLNRMSFDVWGNRQKADWQTGTPAIGELNSFKTTKGYTGHEQLDDHNLIHMDGRVYDPTLGRFLSADLYIQSPYNTQSFNRYSYVFNNPLSLIDPTGYFSDLMQWAMESSYQRSAGWHWNASYQAAQSQINYLQAKKKAERLVGELMGTAPAEGSSKDENSQVNSNEVDSNGEGTTLDVPDGWLRLLVADGTDSQNENLDRWLNEIMKTKVGHDLLLEIALSPRSLKIIHDAQAQRESAGNVKCDPGCTVEQMKLGQNAVMRISLSMSDEGTARVPKVGGGTMKFRAVENLFHELDHVRHILYGTLATGVSNGQSNAETQAINATNLFRLEYYGSDANLRSKH